MAATTAATTISQARMCSRTLVAFRGFTRSEVSVAIAGSIVSIMVFIFGSCLSFSGIHYPAQAVLFQVQTRDPLVVWRAVLSRPLRVFRVNTRPRGQLFQKAAIESRAEVAGGDDAPVASLSSHRIHRRKDLGIHADLLPPLSPVI